MRILAIETSCDETSISIINNGTQIEANLVSSQIKTHANYGGVVPEIAARMHTETIHLLIDKALNDSKTTFEDIDAFAVTYGPGLEGALLVGVAVAKSLSVLCKKPLIGVNHLHGHLYAHFLTDTPPEFPFISLLVSGGHTQLIKVNEHMSFELLGQTRDDAAGEAFDKVARFLELGYPGGPIVEKLAKDGNKKAFSFPRAMRHQGYEFSFSGLKTAVIQQLKALPTPYPVADICASFQEAVIDILWQKSLRACQDLGIPRLSISGGVSANQTLQTYFKDQASDHNITIYTAPPSLCTDNAAMIGAAAYYAYQSKKHPPLEKILSTPNLAL